MGHAAGFHADCAPSGGSIQRAASVLRSYTKWGRSDCCTERFASWAGVPQRTCWNLFGLRSRARHLRAKISPLQKASGDGFVIGYEPKDLLPHPVREGPSRDRIVRASRGSANWRPTLDSPLSRFRESPVLAERATRARRPKRPVSRHSVCRSCRHSRAVDSPFRCKRRNRLTQLLSLLLGFRAFRRIASCGNVPFAAAVRTLPSSPFDHVRTPGFG
jgi:hypothetical protein